MTVKVVIIESERGWGSKIDEIREFGTRDEAETFVTEYNSHNDKPEVPDWYMYARIESSTEAAEPKVQSSEGLPDRRAAIEHTRKKRAGREESGS